MTTYVDDNTIPGSATVFILSRWGDEYGSGTGFIVGNNDVLTAAHVIYSTSKGRLADEIKIYPSFNPGAYDNKEYKPVWVEYFRNFDPDGDGYVYLGDSSYTTFGGSEIDIALLVTNEDLKGKYGSFSIDAKYIGGSASALGYPGRYANRLVGDGGTITRSLVDNSFLINSDLELNPGNSGGPIYYLDSKSTYQAVGIVSTGIAAVNLAAHYSWLTESMLSSDKYLQNSKPTQFYEVTTSGVKSIREGETARFQVNTKGVPGFTELKYQISGIQAADIDLASLTGTFTVNSAGVGFINLPTVVDSIKEGTEVLKLTVGTSSAQIELLDQSISSAFQITSFSTTKIGARTPSKPYFYLNFSEEIAISNGVIELRLGGANGPIVETINRNSISYEGNPSLFVSFYNRTLIIKPSQPLASDEIYCLVAKPGVVQNKNGATFTDNYSSVFYSEKRDIIVSGTFKSEEVWGSSGSDTIHGFSGDDKIYGGPILSDSGNDLIFGGEGNDSISGQRGSDTIYGEGGNDLISGWEGDFDGGDGWDIFDLSHVFSNNLSLQLSPAGILVTRSIGLTEQPLKYYLKNFEALSIAKFAMRIDSKPHGSYADLPDTLYQFFVVGFGAAPGVTYMDQMAEAYRYWLPEYKEGTVKQIVEVFTTKTQFTSVYPQALYREDQGKYYRYDHDLSLPGKPLVRGPEVSKATYDEQMADLAQELINLIVKQSASTVAKAQAVEDVKSALGLGGDWTIGKVIYTVFGNLATKPVTDPVWGGTAKQFANQVAVAKYYTDTLSQSTDDVATLRSVMAAVSNTTDVSSNDAIASLIGVALLNGPGI